MPSYKAPSRKSCSFSAMFFRSSVTIICPALRKPRPMSWRQYVSEAAKLCEETLQPLNQTGDRAGCVRNKDGSVATPHGFEEAYRAFVEGGWVGLAADPDFRGQGLPFTLAAIVNEFASSANMAFAMYPGLSQGALAAC